MLLLIYYLFCFLLKYVPVLKITCSRIINTKRHEILISLWLKPKMFCCFLRLNFFLILQRNKYSLFFLMPWVVPMIRSHKWEWGPPTPQHHPALQCPHYIMHLQTQLTLRNLTTPSQLTSLRHSPCKTADTPWITGILKILFLSKIVFSIRGRTSVASS